MRCISRRPPATTTGLLLTVCGGLLAVICVELQGWTPLSGVAQSRPAGAAAGPAPATIPEHAPEVRFERPPLAMFSEITARPLFSPTRRPPPPPEGVPVERGDFALRGVLLAGDLRVALLQRSATGELVRALEGQRIDGWTVAGITASEAVLESGGDQYVVEFEKAPAAEPATRSLRRAAGLLRADQPRLDLAAGQARFEEPAVADFDDESEFSDDELLDPTAAARAERRLIDPGFEDEEEHTDEELLGPRDRRGGRPVGGMAGG